MSEASPCKLVLTGKSSAEQHVAVSLKSADAINLPENEARIFLGSEIDKGERSFHVDAYMSGLSTRRFGLLLLLLTGIGLNVDNETPNTCLNSVLKKLTSPAYQYEEKTFWLPSSTNLKSFTRFSSIMRVTILEKNEDQLVENVVSEKVIGEARTTTFIHEGLTASGYLLAIGEDSQMYELHPDGNSFDFFKGLVRRKLD